MASPFPALVLPLRPDRVTAAARDPPDPAAIQVAVHRRALRPVQ